MNLERKFPFVWLSIKASYDSWLLVLLYRMLLMSLIKKCSKRDAIINCMFNQLYLIHWVNLATFFLFCNIFIIVNMIEICGRYISTLYELNPGHNLNWSNWRVLDIFSWWSFLWRDMNLNVSIQTSHLRSSLWLAYYLFYTQSACNRHPEI